MADKCGLCGGLLVPSARQGDQCQSCGVRWNPPPYPGRGSRLTKADLVGPENYESLRSGNDYGRRPL